VATPPAKTRTPNEIANAIAQSGDVDVALYNGPIGRFFDEEVISKSLRRKRRSNLLMMLVTEGGNPDSAYRMARCLQSKYQKFSVFISGYCKSAGTLIAIGAHELVIGDHGELGPLDIQMAKKDELVDRQSGLTVISALDFLREKAYSSFEEIFYDFEEKTGGIVTVQTASKIAVEIVTGIISPIASQIDPLHVGDAARSLRIAEQYGFRLAQNSKSIQPAGLLRLLTGYASHGFVIDRREATTIFGHVREPSANELELSEVLGPKSKRPANPRPTLNQVFEFLSDEVQPRVGARHGKGNAISARKRRPSTNSGIQPARTRSSAGKSVSTGPGRKQQSEAPKIQARSREGRSGRKGNGLTAN
jgi:Serine dehydrogenase proteinase